MYRKSETIQATYQSQENEAFLNENDAFTGNLFLEFVRILIITLGNG